MEQPVRWLRIADVHTCFGAIQFSMKNKSFREEESIDHVQNDSKRYDKRVAISVTQQLIPEELEWWFTGAANTALERTPRMGNEETQLSYVWLR